MSKDPAFLFYPNDWHSGTMTMSRHLKGCYIDLLIAQFNSGPLSLEEIKIVLGADFSAWSALSKKFTVDETGKYFNERLAAEKAKRVEFSIKQKDRIKKRWNKNGIYHGNTAVLPLCENENRNENENEISSFEKYEKLFFKLTEAEQKNSIEYLDRVAQKKLNPPELENFFEAFKIQYVKDFYPNRSEVIKHFRNWLKNQKHATNSKPDHGSNGTANGTSTKRIAALKQWGTTGI